MRLTVVIVEARNIKAGNLMGLLSNPYCKVTCKQCSQQTKHISLTRAPVWNQSFTLDVSYGEELKFVIYNYNALQKNEKLGTAKYNLKNVTPNQTADTWLSLKKQGELHVRITLQAPPPQTGMPPYDLPPHAYGGPPPPHGHPHGPPPHAYGGPPPPHGHPHGPPPHAYGGPPPPHSHPHGPPPHAYGGPPPPHQTTYSIPGHPPHHPY
ncbi:Toll-interacting protein [Entamoeba marina]